MSETHASTEKISTGIPIVDNLLSGGVPRGSSILIKANPLSDPSTLVFQYLRNRLKEGDIGVYFLNNKKPECVLEDSQSVGLDIKDFRDKTRLFFIDSFSALFGLVSTEKYSVSNIDDFSETSNVVTKALIDCSEKGKVFFVYDALNTSYDQFGGNILNTIKEWSKIAIAYDAILCFIYSDWSYPHEFSEAITGLFPNIIDLLTIERLVGTNVVTASKSQGFAIKKKLMPIKKTFVGGIKGYIPKILVTGPYHAGKTTLVQTLSTRAVSVQRMGTTVALDFGHVDYRGFMLDLFGTVGQPRFDPILHRLGGEALGVILVVDSTKPEEFSRAKEMMRKANVYGLPYVIAANKQDLPNALAVEEVKRKMDTPDDVQVIGTVATDKVSVLKALDKLLDKIIFV